MINEFAWKGRLYCPDCGNLAIACKCDSRNGWCDGCPLCEPEGWAHKKDELPQKAKEGEKELIRV